MDAQPDLTQLSDEELKSLIRQLTEEERSVSMQRRVLHGRIELLKSELVGRLKEAFPGIVSGVKDSSGDWTFTQQLLAAHSDLSVLIGDERYLAEGVRRAGQGAISGIANVCPAALLPLAVHGQGDERINRLVDEVLRYPVIPAVKTLVAHRTGDTAWLRVKPPLMGLATTEAEQLTSLYDRLFTGRGA